MAPVVRELQRRPDTFEVKVCVTAQHREMLDQVLRLFQIVPDYDLDIMRPRQSLTDVTVAVLQRLEPILSVERPDWVLVQGDTTTVLAASLAAYYQQIRVGHVEAGLRTYDKYAPFPEELNRRVATIASDLHFAPTAWAADNLEREGVSPQEISITGNSVIDAIQYVAALPFDPAGTVLADLPFGESKIILVTAHRRENFGRGMEDICASLRTIAMQHQDVHFAYPVHLNPNVQEPVYRLLKNLPNVTLLPPLDYRPLVWLLQQCYFVITDSGGLQEEALGLGKPVLVMRDTTERPEGQASGSVQLVGTDSSRIVGWASRLLGDQDLYATMALASNPYGNGNASTRIAEAILSRTQRDGLGSQVNR